MNQITVPKLFTFDLGQCTVGPPVANTPNRKFGPLPFWQTQWADPLHNNDSILE